MRIENMIYFWNWNWKWDLDLGLGLGLGNEVDVWGGLVVWDVSRETNWVGVNILTGGEIGIDNIQNMWYIIRVVMN